MTTRVASVNDNFCRLLKTAVYYTLFATVISSQFLLPTKPILAQPYTASFNEIQNGVEEKVFDIEAEKNFWNISVKKRYKNGAILTVTDGVKHIRLTKYINSRPVKINIIEINKKLNPQIDFTPILAGNKLASKRTAGIIAQKNNTIAAINGTYFSPPSGVPLGTLMINGKLYTGPIYNRVALGIFDNDFDMARVQLNAIIRARDGVHLKQLKIDNINQPRMLSTYVLVYTPEWGATAPPPPKYGTLVSIKDNKIIQISNGSIAIPDNGYVISGPKVKLEPFFNANNFSLEIKTIPEWEQVKHIISGGPYLVHNSEVYTDTSAQKLTSVTGRNPRTGIGYTKDKNLIMVTVDGREETSVGMTLNEFAAFMKSIGCIEAMNLDGGGSSTMYLNGRIVNQPSIKGGIALSNIFAVTLNEKNLFSYSN